MTRFLSWLIETAGALLRAVNSPRVSIGAADAQQAAADDARGNVYPLW